MKRIVIAWLVLAAAAAAGAQSPAGHENHRATATPVAPRLVTPPPVLDGIWLVDSARGGVSLAAAVDTEGPVLVNFIFTSCTTVCPVMTAGFAQLHAALGDRRDSVRLVSISIDPDVDTPATLRAYAGRHGAGPSWRFLTGARASIVAAQRAFGAYRGDITNHAPATYFRRDRHATWQAVDGLSSAASLHLLVHGPS